ncbi:MAG TPA: hypothetical protein VN914_02315 [Polyangia bacterium]|nr:hypothetical protein [Polyangia bacterium]
MAHHAHQPPPLHTAPWHLLDSNFTDKNKGLTLPDRLIGVKRDIPFAMARTADGLSHSNTLACIPGALRIENLDRADPPNYKPGDFPREVAFNGNVKQISAEPHMPVLEVQCSVFGFDPATTPIFWRLQCLHVLSRHYNAGDYRYASLCERLEHEWQGKAKAASFKLFDPADGNVTYDFGGGARDRVMGGHALLSVAARVPGMPKPLLDFVHLRIGGTNPTAVEVLTFLNSQIGTRHANIQAMIRAVFAHESNYHQFTAAAQSRATMRFRNDKQHQGGAPGQTECAVRFDWPDDPPHFPLATYDFGIGISQYTRTARQMINAGVVWDWRENIKRGFNILMDKMRIKYPAGGGTWRTWARASWSAYNGKGDQAVAYAQTLSESPNGKQVTNDPLPSLGTLTPELAPLSQRPTSAAAPAWPPPP